MWWKSTKRGEAGVEDGGVMVKWKKKTEIDINGKKYLENIPAIYLKEGSTALYDQTMGKILRKLVWEWNMISKYKEAFIMVNVSCFIPDIRKLLCTWGVSGFLLWNAGMFIVSSQETRADINCFFPSTINNVTL